MKYTIMVSKPTIVEIEAPSFEEAIKIIRRQMNVPEMEYLEFEEVKEVKNG